VLWVIDPMSRPGSPSGTREWVTNDVEMLVKLTPLDLEEDKAIWFFFYFPIVSFNFDAGLTVRGPVATFGGDGRRCVMMTGG